MSDISEFMNKCTMCNISFPSHLINMLFVNGKYIKSCPLCAQEIVNKTHGLPEGTPFRGEIAQDILEEAIEFLGGGS